MKQILASTSGLVGHRSLARCGGVSILTLALSLVVSSGSPQPAMAEEEVKSKTEETDAVTEKSAESDEEVVVSASLLETPLKETASSITIIQASEIQKRQKTSVQEVLETVPGLDVVRSGGPGGNTSVFMRGTNSEHTLVLLDGVELNDPSSSNRSFNFADLTVDGVERIEVVRGSQSPLYGGDAVGGVINIISKKGKGAPSATASIEGGSYGTIRGAASAGAGFKRGGAILSASSMHTGGVSAARSSSAQAEQDGYDNSSVTATDWLRLTALGRYQDVEADIDNFGGDFGDDPNRLLDSQQTVGKLAAETSFFDDKLRQVLSLQYTGHDRDDNNDVDALNDTFQRSSFEGDLMTVRLQNDVEIHPTSTLSVGGEHQSEQAKTYFFSSSSAFGDFTDVFPSRHADTVSFFAQDETKLGKHFIATAGVRYDDNSRFGDEWTYRVAPALLFDETGTKLRSSYSTGFKAPSLVQLFSSFGNPDLKAEESRSVDAGVDQEILKDRLKASATLFWTELENLVTFDSNTFVLSNISEARTRGVETELNAKVTDSLSWIGGYTLTDTEDRQTGDRLLRRPVSKFSSGFDVAWCEKSRSRATFTYTGSRADNDFNTFPATRVRLGSYTLLDLSTSYDLTKAVELYARFDNVFDKEYEDVLGFGTLGAAGYGGVRVKL
jgi:vitamin B12 transporter